MTFRFNELSKYGCILDASMYFQYVFLSITSISKKMCGWCYELYACVQKIGSV